MLADKRRDEETAAYLREWCQARGRMEAEIQRRKEHLNDATNFEKARGFVRTNWSSKNWNINDDPTELESSTDSEDAEVMYRDERRDTVNMSGVGSPLSKQRSVLDSEDRDNFDGSGTLTRNNDSLNLTNQQLSIHNQKDRKKLYMQKPIVVDISDNQSDAATMPSVQQQYDTLIAIQDYNKALKPARKAKDSLPEIATTGIATRDRFVKDKKQKIGVERSYH